MHIIFTFQIWSFGQTYILYA